MATNYGTVKIVDMVGRYEVENLSCFPQLSQFGEHAGSQKSPKRVLFHLALADELVNLIKEHDRMVQFRQLFEYSVGCFLNLRQTFSDEVTRVNLDVLPVCRVCK